VGLRLQIFTSARKCPSLTSAHPPLMEAPYNFFSKGSQILA